MKRTAPLNRSKMSIHTRRYESTFWGYRTVRCNITNINRMTTPFQLGCHLIPMTVVVPTATLSEAQIWRPRKHQHQPRQQGIRCAWQQHLAVSHMLSSLAQERDPIANVPSNNVSTRIDKRYKCRLFTFGKVS